MSRQTDDIGKMRPKNLLVTLLPRPIMKLSNIPCNCLFDAVFTTDHHHPPHHPYSPRPIVKLFDIPCNCLFDAVFTTDHHHPPPSPLLPQTHCEAVQQPL